MVEAKNSYIVEVFYIKHTHHLSASWGSVNALYLHGPSDDVYTWYVRGGERYHNEYTLFFLFFSSALGIISYAYFGGFLLWSRGPQ